MCGDGGNDAGALKQAEVGLALFAGQGATNTEEPVQSVGEGDSEKMLNERQLEIAKRAKDVQKLRAQFIKDKQKELQQEQMVPGVSQLDLPTLRPFFFVCGVA